ncbi:hypothetical protein MARINON1_52495 [Marinobacter salarius]|nr:hypothetical protein [Marinobacter salarius]VVT02705.1 hypothetical protein MBHK15_110252 [Marinobacter salarius]VXC25571.1 hypothetical protein MARINON1_52495 [Marinobacter salarius]
MEVQFIKAVLNLLTFYIQNVSARDPREVIGVVLQVLWGITGGIED